MTCEPHVALSQASCGSHIRTEECVSYICLLLLSSIGYICVVGKYGVDAHVSPLI